ncbi:MAG: sulfurtransferase [Pseudohongiellaceae bacterium]
MSQLITAQALVSLMPASELMVFDTRASLADAGHGRRLYEELHIPGAFFLDLEEDLSGSVVPGETGRHPLPDPDLLEARLRELGLRCQDRVVVYDEGPGFFAARLWWLLRWMGMERVQVLDGGFQAWQASELPVSQHQQPRDWPGDFSATIAHERTIAADEVMQHLESGQLTLMDARSPERFRGEQEPIDPVAGHIPGAHCLPCAGNIDDRGFFRSRDQLRERFHELPRDDGLVSYCGSGVTACHNILAAVEAGLPEPRLYPGSWSEWITHPDRPVSTS